MKTNLNITKLPKFSLSLALSLSLSIYLLRFSWPRFSAMLESAAWAAAHFHHFP